MIQYVSKNHQPEKDLVEGPIDTKERGASAGWASGVAREKANPRRNVDTRGSAPSADPKFSNFLVFRGFRSVFRVFRGRG